jgi:hypothetical protein
MLAKRLEVNKTALVKISNDILSAKDRGEETTIVMFDPSAAFETMLKKLLSFYKKLTFIIFLIWIATQKHLLHMN